MPKKPVTAWPCSPSGHQSCHGWKTPSVPPADSTEPRDEPMSRNGRDEHGGDGAGDREHESSGVLGALAAPVRSPTPPTPCWRARGRAGRRPATGAARGQRGQRPRTARRRAAPPGDRPRAPCSVSGFPAARRTTSRLQRAAGCALRAGPKDDAEDDAGEQPGHGHHPVDRHRAAAPQPRSQGERRMQQQRRALDRRGVERTWRGRRGRARPGAPRWPARSPSRVADELCPAVGDRDYNGDDGGDEKATVHQRLDRQGSGVP